MSQNPSFKKALRISIVIVFAALMTSIFQNCGGGQTAFRARQAYIPVTILENELVEMYARSLTPELCREQRYYCQHRHFSQNVDYGEFEAQFPCVSVEGARLCPQGRVYTYNSTAAAQACGDNCAESYEFDEYNCHFELATYDEIRPLQATAATLEEALAGTHAACLRVARKAQGGER